MNWMNEKRLNVLKLTACLLLAMSATFAFGCNTVEGAGEDIEDLGEGVSDAADGD